MEITKWDLFELTLEGPQEGNPFEDIQVTAKMTNQHRTVPVEGFYDGDGIYKIRFMPDEEGEWQYQTASGCTALDGITGSFFCTPARAGAHGPVRVNSTSDTRGDHPFRITSGTRFCYADHTDYQPVGTTCYCWTHQTEALEELTLTTLKDSPFNKIRMCVFPKHYDFNHNEPRFYPFEGSVEDGWDYSRFNPEFFRHLELRVGQLMELGIECDLILFHPYDCWGFSKMPPAVDRRYLRYLTARLSAYRNIWWSLANEYDLMPSKSMADWDDFFQLLQTCDPVGHLRSIHNCRGFYDHSKGWVTHLSVQHSDLTLVSQWLDQYQKPVVVDECCYEGNVTHAWGNITAKEMVHRMWEGFGRGGYVGHGETYMDPEDVLWWAKGGTLHGESPKRIAFLRSVFEQIPGNPVPMKRDFGGYEGIAAEGGFQLIYYGDRQQAVKQLRLPEDGAYQIEILDAWNCTVTPMEGRFSGKCEIPMPGLPYQALRITRL